MLTPVLLASALFVQTPTTNATQAQDLANMLRASHELMVSVGSCEHVLPEEVQKEIRASIETDDPMAAEFLKNGLEEGRKSPSARNRTLNACMIDILDKAAKFQVLSDAITPNNPD